MRVLIVYHGQLPGTGRPATGGGVRAAQHRDALTAAGHEVVLLARDQDEPGGFCSPADLLRRGRHIAPARVISVQPEDAPALAGLGVPLAVDLYAPRLLEAPFEGRLALEATTTMRALAAGDVFLVSNPRQRMAWLGVLALAGVDTRSDPTRLVELAAPTGPRRRRGKQPVLVAGGASWPWQDPRAALDRVLQALDAHGRGEVHWYGGPPLVGASGATWSLPEHPRLQAMGWVPRAELLAAYSRATAAIDWMAPNPERSLAFSFRHADYLGCGLPILTGPDTALADVLGDAGWATLDIEGALEQVLNDPAAVARAGKAARALAKTRYSVAATGMPLVEWVRTGTRHGRAQGPLADAGALAAAAARAEARAAAAIEAQARAEAEVAHKRQEAGQRTAQIQQLMGVVDRLSRAVDEVAGFKREAVTVLGNQGQQARLAATELAQEVGTLRADIAKKNAELAAKDELLARLEQDIFGLREELERQRRKGLFQRG